jgi:hypothetical protein
VKRLAFLAVREFDSCWAMTGESNEDLAAFLIEQAGKRAEPVKRRASLIIGDERIGAGVE